MCCSHHNHPHHSSISSSLSSHTPSISFLLLPSLKDTTYISSWAPLDFAASSHFVQGFSQPHQSLLAQDLDQQHFSTTCRLVASRYKSGIREPSRTPTPLISQIQNAGQVLMEDWSCKSHAFHHHQLGACKHLIQSICSWKWRLATAAEQHLRWHNVQLRLGWLKLPRRPRSVAVAAAGPRSYSR
jgi:hypothetical protein